MNLKVHHKGLIIVMTPLLIELVLIGSLACLVALTDRHQLQASSDRDLSILAARMVFSNIRAVRCLSWGMRDVDFLKGYSKQTAKTRAYLAILSSTQPAHDSAMVSIEKRLVEAEKFTLATLDQIAEIDKEGFSPGNFLRVMAIESTASKRLDEAQSLVSKFSEFVNKSVQNGQLYLQHLYQASSAVVFLGVGLNLAAAFGLLCFFKRNFDDPISVIRGNVERIESKTPLHSPLSGADEIAELDHSFHEMNRQLQLASKKERALFDNSSDIICVVSEQLEIERVNRASQSMLGYMPSELSGEPLNRLVPTASLSRVFFELEQAKQMRLTATFETEVNSLVGTEKSVLWSVLWAERQRCWYCILHDISEQKNIEQTQRELVRLIASDFEQPLMRMSALIQQLDSEALGTISDQFKENLAGAARTVPRLVKLVGDLVQIEHLESTEISLEHTNCSIAAVFEDARRDVQVAANQNQNNIVVQCDDGLWQIDDQKIVRVLVNLLSNAIKFSPRGSTIYLKSQKEGNAVLVQVVDEGRGIPAEALTSLFQPFQQVERADGKRGKGTGLGLLICKRIVEQHGGEIGVESEPGRGSTFWFRIPVDKSTARHKQTEQLDDTAAPKGLTEGVETNRNSQTQLEATTPRFSSGMGSWSLRKKGWSLVAIPLLFELLFVASILLALMQAQENFHGQIHNHELTAPAINLTVNLAAIAYSVSEMSRDPDARENCKRHLNVLAETARSLKNIAAEDAQESIMAQIILLSLDKLTPAVERLVKVAEQGTANVLQYLRLATDIVATADGITVKIERLLDKLDALNSAALAEQARTRSLLQTILWAGLALNVTAALGLSFCFSRDVVRRLRILSDNSKRFAAGLPLAPALPGNDEISQLDRDFRATTEKVAEQRARERAFLDYSRSIICSLNENGLFMTTNPATHKVLGKSAEELLTRISIFDLLDDQQVANVREVLMRSKHSQTPQEFETSISVEGRRIVLLWSASWSPEELCFFCVAHDMTTQRNLERLKKEFIAIITHDLRSPITTLSGMAAIALYGVYGELNPEIQAAVSQISSESKRIIELVNDILDLEKLDVGKLEMERKPIEISQLISKSIEKLEFCETRIETDSICEFKLLADLERLSHALAGLLNGLVHCKPDKVLIGSCGAVRASKQQTTKEYEEIKSDSSRESRDLVQTLCVKMQASKCRADYLVVDGLISCIAGSTGNSSGTTGSRMRIPLARKVIEAHSGKVTANSVDNDVVIEIAFSASGSDPHNQTRQQ
jgi:PAS domain S-box-containing protein